MSGTDRAHVVICGSGVAGLEGALKLRALAGAALDITVISPSGQFVHRPQAARQPFTTRRPETLDVGTIADDLSLAWVKDELKAVDKGTVVTKGGSRIGFDALLIAVGARRLPPPPGAVSFSDRTAEALKPLFRKVFIGSQRRILFAEPDGPCWPLPIYELALQTARVAAGNGHRAEVHLSVPGPRPLDVFGVEAGLAVEALCDQLGVTLHVNSTVESVGTDCVTFSPTGAVDVELAFTVPRLSGPLLSGLPATSHDGFLVTDAFSHVVGPSAAPIGDGRIFAAGDCTNLPFKHGGVGSQQADTAASGIAALFGFAEKPAPLHPVIEGRVYTGGDLLHLRAQLIAGRGWHASARIETAMSNAEKLFAAELTPYLTRLNA